MLNGRYSDLCSWLGFLGWCLTMSSLWLLPAYAIYKYNITEVMIVFAFLIIVFVLYCNYCGCFLLLPYLQVQRHRCNYSLVWHRALRFHFFLCILSTRSYWKDKRFIERNLSQIVISDQGTFEERLRKITQPEETLPTSTSKDTRLATPQVSDRQN